MKSEPDEGTVLDLLGSLWAVNHGLHAVSKRMRSRVGVTGPQRVVLRMVGREDGISPGRLARAIHDDPSTLTGVLHRLEARGLLERTADPVDRRRFHLHLTEAGAKVNEVREGTVEEAVRAAIRRLAPSQLAATAGVLGALVEELALRSGAAESP